MCTLLAQIFLKFQFRRNFFFFLGKHPILLFFSEISNSGFLKTTLCPSNFTEGRLNQKVTILQELLCTLLLFF